VVLISALFVEAWANSMAMAIDIFADMNKLCVFRGFTNSFLKMIRLNAFHFLCIFLTYYLLYDITVCKVDQPSLISICYLLICFKKMMPSLYYILSRRALAMSAS
jgi:hypothetical protein